MQRAILHVFRQWDGSQMELTSISLQHTHSLSLGASVKRLSSPSSDHFAVPSSTP